MRLFQKQLKGYLKEPYPYYYGNTKRLLFLLLIICVLSFSFSYFFQPFDVNVTEHKINFIWILCIHAFIPFPIALGCFMIINRIIKEEVTWTLGKEIVNLSIVLLLIGIVDFLIRDLIYTNPNNWSFGYLWEEIRNTFLVGVLILMIVLPLNLERLINKHSSSLKKLSNSTSNSSSNKVVAIKTPIVNESFDLKTEEFLYAKVESNYIELFITSSNVIKKTLIRMTLKELQDQLEAFPFIFKSHRSYLVNLHAIESSSGNAQGYQLLLKNCSVTIPVSRSNITNFNAIFSKT